MGMKYKDPSTGQLKELSLKAADTLPIGTIVDYDGEEVPEGWEEVADYSTEEVKTNKVWIDGKPIYRAVIYYENVIPTSDVHAIPNYIKNVDEIIKFESLFYQNTNKQYEGPYYVSSADFFRCVLRLENNDFVIQRGSRNSDTNKVKIILEYTKTTD